MEEILNLPPPPSEISNDYVPGNRRQWSTPPPDAPQRPQSRPATPTPSAQSALNVPNPPSTTPSRRGSQAGNSNSNSNDNDDDNSNNINNKPTKANAGPDPSRPQPQLLSEEETRISIDLLFAIITELYSLSSAWTIRLSLLSAARTFLLRPNSPQLDSIRALLQDSVIDAHLSDTGVAAHLDTLRYNTVPTEAERASWPPELTGPEKERLRVKARRLLVERGMPQALTGVMGQAASGEALGKVFDCLQVDSVARGLVFALLLQAIRAATQ